MFRMILQRITRRMRPVLPISRTEYQEIALRCQDLWDNTWLPVHGTEVLHVRSSSDPKAFAGEPDVRNNILIDRSKTETPPISHAGQDTYHGTPWLVDTLCPVYGATHSIGL